MKKCLKAMGIGMEELPFRLSLIPYSSRAILEYAWLNKERVEFTQKQYDEAVNNLWKTQWLVEKTDMGETLIFQEGYEDFNLAVSAGCLRKMLFSYDELIYDKSAEAFYEALCEALGTLTEKERTSILMYFGFDDGEFHTYKEVGEKYGVSGSAILQRVNVARWKLKKKHKKELCRSKEFYTLESTIRETARTQVKAESRLYLKALENISILVLDLPEDMKKLLAERACNTLGGFLSFNQTEGLSHEMMAAIKQKKLDFYMEMFDIE